MNGELEEAITHIDTYGYCLLKGRIPEEVARSMTDRKFDSAWGAWVAWG